MRRTRRTPSKGAIIAVAVIVSIVLYMSGVFSGLYANKVFKEQAEEDIESLKKETEQEFRFLKKGTEEEINMLRDYLGFLENNIQSMQLEQQFVETLEGDERCRFSGIAFENLMGKVRQYWKILPYRIEEYEKNHNLTSEYRVLKEQYTHLALRTWLMARSMSQECEPDIIYALYFYSQSCDQCIDQGKELDQVSYLLRQDGRDVFLFSIDINSSEPMVQSMVEYHNLTGTPSLIIQDMVYTDEFVSAERIMEDIR